MNALYLSYDGLTDPLGQSQVLPYLVGLTKNGISFTVISFEKKELYDKRKDLINNICEQSNITWLPQFYTKRPPVLSTLYDIFQLNRFCNQLIKNNKPGIVHCRSYITALIGLKLKQKHKIPFIFDMRGFWADERVDGSIWNLKNPLFKRIYTFFKQKEIQFLNAADHTISLTYNAKDEILSWNSIKKDIKIEVIPCCTDSILFNRNNYTVSQIAQQKKKLDINKDEYIISYSGSIGTWYMLEEMLDFFKVLKTQKTNARFLFITKDDEQPIISKAKEKNIPTSDLIITSAERSEMPLMLLCSNFSLFFIKPAYSKKASSATKMGEIMGMGVPLICNSDVGDTDYILNNVPAGYAIKEFNDMAYKKALETMGQITQENISNLITTGCNYFDLEKGIEKYYQVYKSVSIATDR